MRWVLRPARPRLIPGLGKPIGPRWGLVRLTAGIAMRSLALSEVTCYRPRPVGLGLRPDSTPLHGLMASRYRGGGAVSRHHECRESHPTSDIKLSRSHVLAGRSNLFPTGSSQPNEVALAKTTLLRYAHLPPIAGRRQIRGGGALPVPDSMSRDGRVLTGFETVSCSVRFTVRGTCGIVTPWCV